VTLEQYAAIAEVIAAVAVIVSLIFLAAQIRQYTAEASNANWQVALDRYIAMSTRCLDEELADVITRGLSSYRSLSESERFTFSGYMVEVGLTHEPLIFLPKGVLREDIRLEVPRRHLTHWYSYPGVQEWWTEYRGRGGFAPRMTEYVDGIVASINREDR
jgi:hypothetical protein